MDVVLIAALSAMGADASIVIDRPEPVVVLVNVPRFTRAHLRIADIIDAGNIVLSTHTDLALVEPAQASVSEVQLRACQGESRLLCWANELAKPSSQSRWLLVVALLPDGPQHVRASAMLLDVARTRAIRGDDQTIVLNRIFEEATVHAPQQRIALEDPVALQRYFEEIYAEKFEPGLSAAGHVTRFARIELDADPGLTVEVDGRVVGTTQHTTTRLTRLRPGPHSVAVHDPQAPERRFDRDVLLTDGEDSTIEVRFATASSSPPKIPMLIAGGLLVGLGAASTVWGATRSNSVQFCFAATCTGDRTTFDGFVPIGVSLTVTGVALGVGSLVADDDTAWWLIVGATIIGVAAGGVTAAVQ